MANQAIKKLLKANESFRKTLLIQTFAVNAIFFGLRYVFLTAGEWTFINTLLAAFSVTVGGVLFLSLYSAAAPSLDASGSVVDAGSDMNASGIIEYQKDILYVLHFVQVTSCISDKFWLLFLVVPLYALYMFWIHILKPWIFRPDDLPMDEATLKKMKKMERRQRKWGNQGRM